MLKMLAGVENQKRQFYPPMSQFYDKKDYYTSNITHTRTFTPTHSSKITAKSVLAQSYEDMKICCSKL